MHAACTWQPTCQVQWTAAAPRSIDLLPTLRHHFSRQKREGGGHLLFELAPQINQSRLDLGRGNTHVPTDDSMSTAGAPDESLCL